MELDTFQGNCHKCGKYRHTAKEFWSLSHGGAEKPQCALCEKTSWTVEDGKVTQKETAKEPRRVAFPKEEKGGNQGKGKGKGKKGQRLSEITEPPEEHWTGGSWEQWSDQSWSRHWELPG